MLINSSFRRVFCRALSKKHKYIRSLCVSEVHKNVCIKVDNTTYYRLSRVNKGHIWTGIKEYVSDNRLGMQGICWKCSKTPGTSLFCAHCQCLQRHPRDCNYFQIFNLDETFRLDEPQLSKKYKDLQKQLHPDKYSNRDKVEQEISAEYSSLVNKAYSTLLQPLSRGLYMLKRRGVEISEKTQASSEFLLEIMQKSEQVEEAETEEQVLKLYKEIKDVLQKLIGELAEALDCHDVSRAEALVVRMKYYTSIETQLKDTIRKMGIVE